MAVEFIAWVVAALVAGLFVGHFHGKWIGQLTAEAEALRAGYETGRKDERALHWEQERRSGAHRRTP